MADIFLSYSREDQGTARAVAYDLREEGFSVFFDEDVRAGETWNERIEKEVNDARAVVVLWSEAAIASRWVKREAREAADRHILFPALIEACKIPMEFNDTQAVDIRGRPPGQRDHREWRKLADGLRDHIAGRGGGARTAQPLGPPPKRKSRNSWEMPFGCAIFIGIFLLILLFAASGFS